MEQEIKHAIATQEQESHSLHLEHDTAVLKYEAFEKALSKVQQKQVRLYEYKYMTQFNHFQKLLTIQSCIVY